MGVLSHKWNVLSTLLHKCRRNIAEEMAERLEELEGGDRWLGKLSSGDDLAAAHRCSQQLGFNQGKGLPPPAEELLAVIGPGGGKVAFWRGLAPGDPPVWIYRPLIGLSEF